MERKTLTVQELKELRANLSIAIESVIFGQAKKFGFTDYQNILKSDQVGFCIDQTTQLLATKIFNKKKYEYAKQAKKNRQKDSDK